MGNSIGAVANQEEEGSEEEGWKQLRRIPFFKAYLYPEGKGTVFYKENFKLPCVSSAFWSTAFTERTDMRISPCTGERQFHASEFVIRAELQRHKIDGVEHDITQRYFVIPAVPADLVRGALSYSKEQSANEHINMKMRQAKGSKGYLEFCIEFENPWSKFIQVAGYAIVSDTPDEESPAMLYVVLGIKVDFCSTAQIGCFGEYWLIALEEKIRTYIRSRVLARYVNTVQWFQLQFNDSAAASSASSSYDI